MKVQLAVLLLGLSTATWAQAPKAEPARKAEKPAKATPADKADQDAIEELNRAFVEAWNARQWSKIAEMYTDDGVVMPPNAPSAKGKKDILAYYQEDMGADAIQLKYENISTEVSGDMAYRVARYMMTITQKDGTKVEDNGKYVLVLKKQKGKWLLHVDMYSSDLAGH